MKSFGPTVTKLCSGQGNPDADADADTADQSNPYMSPFLGDTKMIFFHYKFEVLKLITNPNSKETF